LQAGLLVACMVLAARVGHTQTAPGRVVEVATFAAGCFWCVESDFDTVPGVVSTTSGYTGGRLPNPTYRQVSSGGTGHAEAVEVRFDPTVVTYEQLLDHFWRNVDPFVVHRQFCDTGEQYRPEIFVHGAVQRAAAEASRARVQRRFSERVLVRVTDAGPFYQAEREHQGYHDTNPLTYRYYRWTCGRDARLKAIWAGQK
jgi:peptide-methionine (S)-S-oxide reductase